MRGFPELTVFSLPKAFRGHIGIIQRNALRSWCKDLCPSDIILFGDDEGTEETARAFGVRHQGEIERNEHGTPYIHSMFERAERTSRHERLCYINADILILPGFGRTVCSVRAPKFLIVGQRWDLDLTEELSMDQPGWDRLLMDRVAGGGVRHGPTGIDFFVFPRGMWGKIPAFLIGRSMWDNWLLYKAVDLGAALVDASERLPVVHQNHDYAHLSAGGSTFWKGPEADWNLKLGGGYDHAYTIEQATHCLTSEGVEIKLDALLFGRWRGGTTSRAGRRIVGRVLARTPARIQAFLRRTFRGKDRVSFNA